MHTYSHILKTGSHYVGSPGWPKTHKDLLACVSASRMLELKACSIKPQQAPPLFFHFLF